jgi:hypothetical protein
MRLAAIAIGTGTPLDGFAGIVEQVYPQACLLALSDQRLVTLATLTVGHLPRGITLNSSPIFQLRKLCGKWRRIYRAQRNPGEVLFPSIYPPHAPSNATSLL